MPFPKYEDLTLPALRFLAGVPSASPADMEGAMAGLFLLSDDDRRERTSKSQQPRLVANINWACRYMWHAGLLIRPDPDRKSVYGVSGEGLRVLALGLDRIDFEFLVLYPSFREYIAKSRESAKARKKAKDLAASEAADAEKAAGTKSGTIPGGTPAPEASRPGRDRTVPAPPAAGREAEAALDAAEASLRAEAVRELAALAGGLGRLGFVRLVTDAMLARGYSPEGSAARDDVAASGAVMKSPLRPGLLYVLALPASAGPSSESSVRAFERQAAASGAADWLLVTACTLGKTDEGTGRTRIMDISELAGLMLDSGVGTRDLAVLELKKEKRGFFSGLGRRQS
ncbi:MAG: hypothetical protein LBT40_00105 [Deltaproteobacteria bacterium]|jgi:restriction endonuclease Mrr|nr:hypothetical protein [Deltaproteobacteria bacterium]